MAIRLLQRARAMSAARWLILLVLLAVVVMSDHWLIEIGAGLLIVMVGVMVESPPLHAPASVIAQAPVDDVGTGLFDIIENIGDYVAIVNLAGHVTYINQAGRALIGMEQVSHVAPSFFLPQWALDCLGQSPDQRFVNGLWKADGVIHLMDEINIPVSQTIFAHLDGAGRVNQLATICRDRLEQRFVEESAMRLMVQSERLKALQEMIAHFTHDLRAPLTSIVTGLFLAEKQAQDTERRQARFDAIRDQTRLLEMMIQDVLTYSRFEVVPALDRQPIQLTELLDKIRQNLAPQIENKGIQFELSAPPAGCQISGDVDGLTRLFGNLIENAVKYTLEQGQVKVRLEAVDDWVTVVIQDTGIGIEEAEIPRIFEQFFRASSAKDFGIVGTGVGLAIVKRVVDLHGGTIAVSSALGQGTTFTVRLPVTEVGGG